MVREVASPAGGVAVEEVEEVEETSGDEEGLVGGEGAEPEGEVIKAVVGGRPVAGVVESGVGAEMVGRGAEDEEAHDEAEESVGDGLYPWVGDNQEEAGEAKSDADDPGEHGACVVTLLTGVTGLTDG